MVIHEVTTKVTEKLMKSKGILSFDWRKFKVEIPSLPEISSINIENVAIYNFSIILLGFTMIILFTLNFFTYSNRR
jgi:hypothetical protein